MYYQPETRKQSQKETCSSDKSREEDAQSDNDICDVEKTASHHHDRRMIQRLSDDGLHGEDGPAAGVWLLPGVPAQHDDICDPPVHGHQDHDGLARPGQHLSSALSNAPKLYY